MTQEAELASWVASVLELVRRPFAVGPRKLRLSATLGGALWPLDGQSSADLLRHTDQALFEARRQKRATSFTSPGITTSSWWSLCWIPR